MKNGMYIIHIYWIFQLNGLLFNSCHNYNNNQLIFLGSFSIGSECGDTVQVYITTVLTRNLLEIKI